MMRLKLLTAVLCYVCAGCMLVRSSRDDTAGRKPELAFDQSVCRKQCAAEQLMRDGSYCGTDKKTYTACEWACGDVPAGVSVWPESCQADGSPRPGSPAEPADGDRLCDYIRVGSGWAAISCSNDLGDMAVGMSPMAAAMSPVTKSPKEGWTPSWLKVQPMEVLPADVDLRSRFGQAKNQGAAGTCTAFATTAAMESLLATQGHSRTLSEMHLWARYHHQNMHLARVATSQGVVSEDFAARTGFGYDWRLAAAWDSGNEAGSEKKEPDIAKLGLLDVEVPAEIGTLDPAAIEPPEGAKHATTAQIATMLAKGEAVVVAVYMSTQVWARAESGIIPEYDLDTTGAHALLAVGYKRLNGKRYFILRNSWGPNLGDSGYYYISDGTLDRNMMPDTPSFTVRRRGAVSGR
ncbi:C1 family peptidase [Archangium sp.]|jgi:hypothetical protein|uniref:C1 family peptidase n=1 Tax=Archangium sp. TaxID=1872627 RepID=UPI002EDB4887